jgi:hypothetical protein
LDEIKKGGTVGNFKIKNLAKEIAAEMVRVQAINHVGWAVEIFVGRDGWVNEVLDSDMNPKIFTIKSEADATFKKFQDEDGDNEYRVTEVVK